jgi:hypothetical protein
VSSDASGLSPDVVVIRFDENNDLIGRVIPPGL